MRRTIGGASGAPLPQAWLRIRLSCSLRVFEAGMTRLAKAPKPVLMP